MPSLPGLGAPCPWKQLGKSSIIMPFCCPLWFSVIPGIRVFVHSSQCHNTCLLRGFALGEPPGERKTSLPSWVLFGVSCAWQLLSFPSYLSVSLLIFRDAESSHRSAHRLSPSFSSVSDFIKDPKRALLSQGSLMGISLTHRHRCTFSIPQT